MDESHVKGIMEKGKTCMYCANKKRIYNTSYILVISFCRGMLDFRTKFDIQIDVMDISGQDSRLFSLGIML